MKKEKSFLGANKSKICFHHTTMNSGHDVMQEVSEAVPNEEFENSMIHMIDKAVDKRAAVLDGTFMEMKVDIANQIYEAKLYLSLDSNNPVLITAGAFTERGADYIWNKQLQAVRDKGLIVRLPKKPNAPFALDVLTREMAVKKEISHWTGSYASAIAGVMFQTFHRINLAKEQVKKMTEHNFQDRSKQTELKKDANLLEVGKCYSKYLNHPEGFKFDVTDTGAVLQVYMKHPTVEEKNQFKAEKRFELNFACVDGIIFSLMKVGNLNWMDAPYNVYLSRNLTSLPEICDGTGLAMTLELYDTSTGELCSQRLIGLSTQISRMLVELIKEQRKVPFNPFEYERDIQRVYSKYSTKQMLKFASNKRFLIREE